MLLKHYCWLAYLLLVTLIAGLGADMLNTYLRATLAAPLSMRPSQAGQTPGQPPPATPADYAIIAARNVFNAQLPRGGPLIETPRSSPLLPDVPPTQLSLKLVGIVAGTDTQRFAIIADLQQRGSQGVYQVGDTIQHAVITSLRRDCVDLSHGGRSEELCF